MYTTTKYTDAANGIVSELEGKFPGVGDLTFVAAISLRKHIQEVNSFHFNSIQSRGWFSSQSFKAASGFNLPSI
jgi:hypothetical protein